MDPGRQRLSQRRKAAAFTHGSRTDLLASELSIIIRPETVGTEPLPPAWRNVTSASPVSMDQLADVFTEKIDATRSPGAARPEFPESTQAQRPYRPSPAATPARSWRLKRFPAAGLLAAALAGGAASVLMGPPHRVPVPEDSPGTPSLTAPVVAVPAPDPVAGTSSPIQDAMGAGQPAPATEPDKATDSATSSRTNAVPSRPEAQSEHRITIRHQPSAPVVTAPPNPAPPNHRPTPAEAYDAWARAAGFDGTAQRWPAVRPEPQSHR